MSSQNAPETNSVASESVTSIKILWLKIQHSSNTQNGNFDFKIGVTSDPGIEVKESVRKKVTISSATTEVRLGDN